MKRRNHSSLYSVLASPFTLVIAVVLFIVLARAAWSLHEKANESSLRLEVAQSDLVKLKESKTDLESRVGQLSTPTGIKEQIRERYHAVEPGESVVVIIDDNNSSNNVASVANASSTSHRTWWQGFLHLFGL